MRTKTKAATIPKTARGKKRYILVRLESESTLSAPILSKGVLNWSRSLYGSVGLARQKLKVIFANEKLLVLRCSLETVSDVTAGIVLWNSIENQPLKTRVVLVSGSLKKIKAKTGF